MEEYKDVMLSELPSRFAAAPPVQSMSLENYKGILLCDRPLANQPAHTKETVAFLPAGKSEGMLGLPPSIEDRTRTELSKSMRQSHKIDKPSAVTKHKKWLRSFAAAVRQMQLDKAEKQLTTDTLEKKFREEQADLRLQYRSQVQKGDEEAAQSAIENESKQAAGPVIPTEAAPPPPKPTQSEIRTEKPPLPLPPLAEKGPKKKQKPKWAMTEDEALEAELGENKDLIDFAMALDYDKFIDDFEVREAIAIMRDRVKEIATEKNIDIYKQEEEETEEDDEVESTIGSEFSEVTRQLIQQRRAEKRERKQFHSAAPVDGKDMGPGWNFSTKVAEKLRSALSADALELAEKILESNPTMAKIHTKQSLAKVLQDCALNTSIQPPGAKNVPVVPPVAPPVVATYSAESMPQTGEKHRILTELRKSKDRVQNMPYMYRCPSI